MASFLRRSASLIGAFAVFSALLAPLPGVAQDDSEPNSIAADGVGVARIDLIDGTVAVQRGDSGDALTAALNAPLLGGDYVTTGNASRAEIQLDGYAHVRLSQNVQMRFTRLDTNDRSLQLAAGTIDLRLMRAPSGASGIDTPSITIRPQHSGNYRVTVTADGRTFVTVRSGDAQIVTPQGEQDLQPGTTLVAQGDAANPILHTESAVAFDDFDRFVADRDRIEAPAFAAASYVNPDIGGVSELPSYGHWVTDGRYGHVWVPSAVTSDWAPYRNGRWVWEDGYGWTWIADEPWGWAPYHYGSWYNSPQYGWCWYPPQPHVVVPWRPALVAFVGFGGGSGFSLSFGGGNAFGNVGWVPLAPYEPYHPWWGNRYGGGTVINNITNITNVTNVTNINVYRNVRYNAVTSVTSQRFLQGNFTHNVAVSAPQLREVHVFRGALPVVPTASNLRFARSTAAPAVSLRPAFTQRAFAGNTTIVGRTPFTAQRVALAAATHAVVTPLHFRDARTTPLVPAQTVQGERALPPIGHEHIAAPVRSAADYGMAHPAAGGRGLALPAANSPGFARPAAVNPGVARPGSGGTAGAWARFNQTRAVDGTVEHGNVRGTAEHGNGPVEPRVVHAAPTVIDNRSASRPAIDQSAASTRAYRTPALSNANTYHPAVAPAVPSGEPSGPRSLHVGQPENFNEPHRYGAARPAATEIHATHAEATLDHHTTPAAHAGSTPKGEPAHEHHERHEPPRRE